MYREGGAMETRAEVLLAAQLAVSKALVVGSSLDDVADVILEEVCGTGGWDFGGIWLVEVEEAVLRCHSTWQREGLELAPFVELSMKHTFPRGVGLPGRVWSSCQPAWIPDVAKDDNFPRAKAAALAGLHAAFCFPVVTNGAVFGVTEFLSRDCRPADEPLLNAMTDMGIRMGQFMARVAAEAQREGLVRRLEETLANVKVLTGLLPVCASCKMIRDEAGRWRSLEAYIKAHTDADVTHGICPECAERLYPGYGGSKSPRKG